MQIVLVTADRKPRSGQRTVSRRRWRIALLLPALLGLSSLSRAEPVRLASRAFDDRAVIEVRDLATADADALIREAFALLAEFERLADRRTGAVSALNRQAGNGPQPAPDELRAMLRKAEDFCIWSQGAHGPLGGRLYDLWGRGEPQATGPAPAALQTALESAACNRMRIDDEAGTIDLAAGSEIDLAYFARGSAIDRAVEHLRTGGANNLWVEIGPVARGVGPGPGERGWFSQVTELIDDSPSLTDLHLRDRAVAVAARDRRPLTIDGSQVASFIDQRQPRGAPITAHPGRPAEGVRAVVAVTELAADAEGLAAGLFILGTGEGQFRLGGLRPTPAILWLLGGELGEPIVTSFHWSQVGQ